MKQINVYADAGYCSIKNIGYFGGIIETDDLNILLSGCKFTSYSTQFSELAGVYNTLYFLKDIIKTKEFHITLVNDNLANLYAINKKLGNKNKPVENDELVYNIIVLLKKYSKVTILHKSKSSSQHIHMCDLIARFVKKDVSISTLGYMLQPFHMYYRVKLKHIFH